MDSSNKVMGKAAMWTWDEVPEATKCQIKAYLTDPDTRVYIKYNNDMGADLWLYSVVVEGAQDFWLDAFPTANEAVDYIRRHHLKVAKEAGLGNAWDDYLSDEAKMLARVLSECIAAKRKDAEIYPPQYAIFRALALTPPEAVRVVIVGQDPYHGRGEANGLAFSVNHGIKIPPSLRNIFKELHSDLGCGIPQSGDLTPWAERGVLLLNTALTVESGKPGSHSKLGWQMFVRDVLDVCVRLPQPVVFVLWGNYARSFTEELPIAESPNKVYICSSHPSPFSAMRGSGDTLAFMGSCPFSETNRLLSHMGAEPIDWSLI